MTSCERGKFKTWSHLFSQLVDVFAIIFATFRQILMRKAKVFAKIRKRKLLFQLYFKPVDSRCKMAGTEFYYIAKSCASCPRFATTILKRGQTTLE
jgi:hypothetical protein